MYTKQRSRYTNVGSCAYSCDAIGACQCLGLTGRLEHQQEQSICYVLR